jgi:hypothetical protein
MTRPNAASKLLLVADRRAELDDPGPPNVRRYRLARLRFESRPVGSDARFEHLKRTYD